MLVRLRTMYGLRRKGTQEYMLERKGGYTWNKFEDAKTKDAPPRLFPSKKAAKIALTMWCKGPMKALYDLGGVHAGVIVSHDVSYLDVETFEVSPLVGKEDRNPDDYEVVSVTLYVDAFGEPEKS